MRNDSLRYLLLQRLLWPLIPILLLGAGLAYVLAQRAAVDAYDLGLLDDAHDLIEQMQLRNGHWILDLPPAAMQMLASNNEDRVIYVAWDSDGKLIGGNQILRTLVQAPVDREYVFQNLVIDDKSYRTIALHGERDGKILFVAVAQTTKSRSYLLREIFFSMLLLGGGLVFISITVVLSGVRRGLAPVEVLRDEIASRSPSDLHALKESEAPIELRPIVHGINELLEKLSASFAGHRRFIADAAHQLRTPLAGLSSQIELSLAQPPTDVNATLKQLLATTRRTSHLANQLLSLARLEHTEQAVSERTVVDLREIVQEAAADFVGVAARKNVELDFSLNSCAVRGSPLLLRELLANLLDNAVRYVSVSGAVTVSLHAQGRSAELAVCDNGAGVPAAELPKLGQPFHRLSTSAPEGCGLGLAIVREIARLHGATVIFENIASGGFCVRVRFPL